MPVGLGVMRMTRPLLIADLFCGAGGSSTGIVNALADRPHLLTCVDHWQTAIETHAANHPAARHHCARLEEADPLKLVPEGRLDLLSASPSCTHHSRARGGRPTSDQQRADPWHVVRWCTTLRVRRLMIENVPEFVDWGPVDPRDGKPIKSRKGEYFRAWCKALQGIGYRLDWRILNAADHGAATTRKRFIMIGRCDRKPLKWPDATHAPSDIARMVGKSPWVPASDIIDWSDLGQSIFARKRPLSDATIKRIANGAIRLGWPEDFLVILRNNCDGRSLDIPLPTITAGGCHIAPCRQAEPFLLSGLSEGAARPVSAPMPTTTTTSRPMLVRSMLAPYYGSGSGETCASINNPLPTISTRDRFALISGHEDPPDILMRFLKPSELSAAMSFDPGYHFAGTKSDQIRQIGNAVPPALARAVASQLMEI